MGDFISFASGAALVFIGSLVMRAYFPLALRKDTDRGAWLLGVAIFLGFVASVGNTLYWQVWGQLAVNNDWQSVQSLRFWGDWFDLLFKGGLAIAGWLHLKAIWYRIPEDERGNWYTLEMPWYPQRRRCIERIAALLNNRAR